MRNNLLAGESKRCLSVVASLSKHPGLLQTELSRNPSAEFLATVEDFTYSEASYAVCAF